MYVCVRRYFAVEKKIGNGQFSVVYRAKNTVDGQIVALKKIQVYLIGSLVATCSL